MRLAADKSWGKGRKTISWQVRLIYGSSPQAETAAIAHSRWNHHTRPLLPQTA